MNLGTCIEKYVEHKRSLGMRFVTEARILKSFCKTVGDIGLVNLRPDQVREFLMVNGRWTRFSEIKYSVLNGFFSFATARDYTTCIPLPARVRRRPQVLVPYIYSRQELVQLFEMASGPYPAQSRIQPFVFRTLLLLLYGAGLRISEALSLKPVDVDLKQAVIYVRNTKFFKTRLVTIGTDLAYVLKQYFEQRRRECYCDREDAPCFAYKGGGALTRANVERIFRRMCRLAGIQRSGGPRNQPRLHDLRHAAAVHRVIEWYRRGQDVQQLLPQLATWLGHVNVASTQRYLTLTPELLNEASQRFERYALEPNHEK